MTVATDLVYDIIRKILAETAATSEGKNLSCYQTMRLGKRFDRDTGEHASSI